MRILHLRRSHGFGGSESYARDLCLALAERGHQVALCCPPGSLLAKACRGTDVRVLTNALRRRLLGGPLLSRLRLLAQARDFRPDVLHSHLPAESRFACWLSQRLAVPCLRTVHDLHADPTLLGPDALVAVSRAAAASVRAAYPELRPEVIHNGVDTDRFHPRNRGLGTAFRGRHGIPADAFVFGTVSRLAPGKNPEMLLRALARLPGAHLLWVGSGRPGYERRLARLAREAGVQDRAHFLPGLSDSHVAHAALDVLAHPSEEEAFSMTLLEAMASGTPVVAARVGGNPEAVAEGETGFLVDPGDEAQLLSALTGLSADPAGRARIGEAARRRVKALFDRQAMVERIEALYRAHAGRTRGPSVGRTSVG